MFPISQCKITKSFRDFQISYILRIVKTMHVYEHMVLQLPMMHELGAESPPVYYPPHARIGYEGIPSSILQRLTADIHLVYQTVLVIKDLHPSAEPFVACRYPSQLVIVLGNLSPLYLAHLVSPCVTDLVDGERQGHSVMLAPIVVEKVLETVLTEKA